MKGKWVKHIGSVLYFGGGLIVLGWWIQDPWRRIRSPIFGVFLAFVGLILLDAEYLKEVKSRLGPSS